MNNKRKGILTLSTMALAMSVERNVVREVEQTKEDKSYLRKKCKSCKSFAKVDNNSVCKYTDNISYFINSNDTACEEYTPRKKK